MIWFTAALFLVGFLLSAFFSGSETGFYRVSRVRLVLDAMDGDIWARGLLWLTNNPALFVATTLIGNNLANYLTSLGVVLGIHQLSIRNVEVAELVAPVAMSPLLFVYGELMPKYLYYRAPNRLLRRGGPLFLGFTALFAPLALVLWTLGRMLEVVLGQTPLRVQLTLARKELQGVLREGQEAGILQPAQNRLAQNLFARGGRNVSSYMVPLGRVFTVKLGSDKQQALRLARRQQSALIPVRDENSRTPFGYLRVIDLHLSTGATVSDPQPLPTIPRNEPLIAAIIQLRTERAEMALVTDADRVAVGVVYTSALLDPLFRGD